MKIIKKIINSPIAIIIALTVLCVILLVSLFNEKKINKMYVGSYGSDYFSIPSLHFFINNDMHYFYSDKAIINDERVVYDYNIGYYVVDNANNFHEFNVRKGSLEKGVQLSDLVNDMSSWNYGENFEAKEHFDEEVLNNYDNLYFVIKASSKYGNGFDINLDFKVDLIKISR